MRRKTFLTPWSYNRLVELQRKICMPLLAFLKMKALEQGTGISFIDSTPYAHCYIKMKKLRKQFNKSAYVKNTIGRFYGFKLHLIINDKGELLRSLLLRVM